MVADIVSNVIAVNGVSRCENKNSHPPHPFALLRVSSRSSWLRDEIFSFSLAEPV
jgi:hypothetical protein